MLPDHFSFYYANQVGILLLLGLSTVIDDLHMDGLLASSGLSVKPSSQSPAVDIVLFCLFTEYQTWEGPKIPSGPMLPHFPEAQVGRRLMKCTWELKHSQEWTLPTLCSPQPPAVSILLLFLNLGLLLFPC